MALPFPGRSETVARFGADGTLTAEGGGSAPAQGAWRWSRGELVVTLEGAASPGRYPWPVLAGLAQRAPR